MDKRRSILITGVHGFSGRFLAEFIAREYPDMDIWGTSRSAVEAIHNVNLVTCDLNDKQTLETILGDIRPRYICHLAGVTHSPDPAEFFRGNVVITINLLEAIRRLTNRIQQTRVLVIGSAAIYGSVPQERLPINEAAPQAPESFYGISKMCQDKVSLEYHRRYNLDIIRAHPFNIIGPGQSATFVCGRIVHKLCEAAEGHSGSVQFGDINAERDFVDIRDVVSAYMALFEHGKAGEAYNIGTGNSEKIASVIERVSNHLNVTPRIETEPGLYGNSACSKSMADIAKIKSDTSWAPVRSLQESLIDMVEARLQAKTVSKV